MNNYGQMIRDQWMALAPSSYQMIPNRDQFFEALGETTLTTVDRLTAHLTQEILQTDDYLNRVGTLNMARKAAEEVALGQIPWPAVEMTTDEAREDWESTRPQEIGLAEWMSALDRPLMDVELEDLSEKWLLTTSFLREMAESSNPTAYLDSHSSQLAISQQLRYSRDMQNQ